METKVPVNKHIFLRENRHKVRKPKVGYCMGLGKELDFLNLVF